MAVLPVAHDAAAICGDSVVDAGEGCDDGGFAAGDGCSPRCEAEASPDAGARKCLLSRNRAAWKLARQQGGVGNGCIAAAARGAEPAPQACLATDPKGKVAKAEGQFQQADAKDCADAPPFGYAEATDAADATKAAGPAWIADVFGADLDATMAATAGDAAAGACQAAVAKAGDKLLGTFLQAFDECQATGLAGGSLRSTSALAGCTRVLESDPTGRVDAASAGLSRTIAAKCGGVDLGTAFPGGCSTANSAAAFRKCTEQRIRCRACLALRTVDALAPLCCDALDDAAMNDSCDAGIAAPASLADAAGLAGIHVGTTVDADLSTARRDLALAEFTSATVENSLKWAELSGGPGVLDFTDADAAVDMATSGGLRVRGHTLFWDRLNGRPSWLAADVAAAGDPAAQMTSRMQAHAAAVVGRYAGRIAQWDVVNEPLETTGPNLDPANLFYQVLGEQYLDVAFAAAHAADPAAKLFLNETFAELQNAKFSGLVSLVESMVARGVPIDGVGLQGHFFLSTGSLELLRSRLQRITDLGLVVEFTEVDIPMPLFASRPDPAAAQGEAYADVFAACAAVPGCTGVTVWGIDDADTWLDSFSLTAANAPNEPLLFDASLQRKPAYHAAAAALACR